MLTNAEDALLAQIARDTLGLDTLDTRHSDSLDFHEHAVWCVRDALERAFEAGKQAGLVEAAEDAAGEAL